MQTDTGLSLSLSLLLRALSGSNSVVQFMPAVQGQSPSVGLRPIISEHNVLLPAALLDSEIAGLDSLERASVAHAAAHLLYSTPAREVTRLKPMGVAVVSALEDARVEYLLMRRLPGVKRWFCQAMPEQFDGRGVFYSMIGKLSYGLLNDQAPIDDYWVNKARQLFFSVMEKSGLENYDEFRAIASVLANDLGQMRLQFNAQAYVNPISYRDDNSYLWNFNSQYSEPECSIADAAAQPTQTAQPDHDVETQQSARPEFRTYSYPELDYRSGVMRQDWCTVLEYGSAKTGAFERTALAHYTNRKKLRSYKNNARALSREKLFRQQQGDLLDLNAVVESVVLAKQGVMGDGHHYLGHALRKKNISLLVLLDLSASVGALLPGQAKTVLELEKAAATMLAEFALEQGDRVAVHGFCSDQRTGVHYHRYLDFGEPFSSSGLAALEDASPQYSTRMGAALRHGINFLNDAQTDVRSIIMMTDGAPSDIDVFDPQYLVEDAREVVFQARKQGIDIYGLVMDCKAVEQTKKIFGVSRHRSVSSIQSLPRQLESLYRQIKN